MPVLFPSFTSTVAPWLDAPIEKTEADTAKIIADAYGVSVASGMITLIPGSAIISAPPTKPIEDAINITEPKSYLQTKNTQTFPPKR